MYSVPMPYINTPSPNTAVTSLTNHSVSQPRARRFLTHIQLHKVYSHVHSTSDKINNVQTFGTSEQCRSAACDCPLVVWHQKFRHKPWSCVLSKKALGRVTRPIDQRLRRDCYLDARSELAFPAWKGSHRNTCCFGKTVASTRIEPKRFNSYHITG